MVVGLILKVYQPLFFLAVDGNRNYDTARINLLRLLQILQLAFTAKLLHSKNSQIHQADKLVIAISKENAALTKKELKEKKKNGPVYPSVAYELGAQISERTGQEIRVTVPGHMQRGGEPCPYDRVIATRLGAEAAEMIRRKEYGYMVALNNNKIEKIPLADIAGKLKMVDPKSDIIREAKDVGISFGDE